MDKSIFNAIQILFMLVVLHCGCDAFKITIFRGNSIRHQDQSRLDPNCQGDVCIIPLNQSSAALLHRFTRHTRCNRTLPDSIVIELAVFVDHVLYVQFADKEKDPDAALKEFAYTILHTAQLLIEGGYLDPKIELVLSEFQIWKMNGGAKSLHKLRDRKFNMAYYMQHFMQYQKRWKKKTGKSWDHAILLTGFDLSFDGHDRFSGYGTTGSLCMPDSCAVVEARNFKAAYTLVHELGHALGMKHDGQENSCRSGSHLMSPMVLSGSHRFSHCSKAEYRAFLQRLQCNSYLDWCLDKPGKGSFHKEIDFSIDNILPGQKQPITVQCRNSFGPCYRPYIKQGYHTLQRVCQEVWCSDGSSYINASHAALEGTYCGHGKWCRMGRCTKAEQTLTPVDGGWSEWSSGPTHGKCKAEGCTQCLIKGQLRVTRRIRACTNPDPNNGGKSCIGDQYMGIVCHPKVCFSGGSVSNYASKICQSLITERPNHTQVRLFSGSGIQRLSSDHPCAVWCNLRGSSQIYTFFDQFPDGTPCGAELFCIAGKCMKLGCSGSGIVGDHTFCNRSFAEPTQRPYTKNQAKTTVKITTSTQPPTTMAMPPDPADWSGWGGWGRCSKACAPAFRKRQRQCLQGHTVIHRKHCHGTASKYQICSNLPLCYG